MRRMYSKEELKKLIRATISEGDQEINGTLFINSDLDASIEFIQKQYDNFARLHIYGGSADSSPTLGITWDDVHNPIEFLPEGDLYLKGKLYCEEVGENESLEYVYGEVEDGEGVSHLKKEVSHNKPIYKHLLRFQRGGTDGQPSVARGIGYIEIFNNSSTPLTLDDFKTLMGRSSFKVVVINGKGSTGGASNLENLKPLTKMINSSSTAVSVYLRDETTNEETATTFTISSGWVDFEDVSVTPLN